MFSRIRKHLTYANVAMTVALVFAMGGGAYAAGKYVITSTKQISPKILKSLQGKAGASGAAGATGAAGSAGPAGPTGPAGATGTAGAAGKEGPAGPKGETGAPGKEGQTGFTATLPSKKTEQGTWTVSVGAEVPAFTSLSFSIPLAESLEAGAVHYVGREGKAPECPGTVELPKAAVGQLCVYQGYISDIEEEPGGSGTELAANVRILNPIGTFYPVILGAATSGADILFQAASSRVTPFGWGTWAVTAP